MIVMQMQLSIMADGFSDVQRNSAFLFIGPLGQWYYAATCGQGPVHIRQTDLGFKLILKYLLVILKYPLAILEVALPSD